MFVPCKRYGNSFPFSVCIKFDEKLGSRSARMMMIMMIVAGAEIRILYRVEHFWNWGLGHAEVPAGSMGRAGSLAQ